MVVSADATSGTAVGLSIAWVVALLLLVALAYYWIVVKGGGDPGAAGPPAHSGGLPTYFIEGPHSVTICVQPSAPTTNRMTVFIQAVAAAGACSEQ